MTKGNLIGVTEPTLLTTIVRMDELYVYFDAPEGDLVEFQQAMKTSQVPDPTSRKIEVEVGVTNEDGFPHKGQDRLPREPGRHRDRHGPHPRADSQSASRQGVRTLYPGLYARVRVPAGQPKPLLAIPEDCIMTGQEGRFVYVVKPDNIVEQRLVTLGPAVWKAPPAVPGEAPPGWVMTRSQLGPASNGASAVPTLRRVESMVSIRGRAQPHRPRDRGRHAESAARRRESRRRSGCSSRPSSFRNLDPLSHSNDTSEPRAA